MKAGTKRLASEALHADDAERQRFSEIVEKRMKPEEGEDHASVAAAVAETRHQARLQREKEYAQNRGVIYVGHIPHGFYEDQMRKYFSQFGEVTRVRVSRSRKTGGSRGYGFVEFLHDSVAQVAAETMNGYLMFERLLKCHVVPKEKVHHDMFSPRFPFPLNREITRTFTNMERTDTRVERNKLLKTKRLRKQMGTLKSLGIAYNVSAADGDGEEVPLSTAKSAKSAKPASDKKAASATPQNTRKRPAPSDGESAEEEDDDDEIEDGDDIDDEDEEQYTLLLDSDDEDIEFKTPPHTVKKSKQKSHQDGGGSKMVASTPVARSKTPTTGGKKKKSAGAKSFTTESTATGTPKTQQQSAKKSAAGFQKTPAGGGSSASESISKQLKTKQASVEPKAPKSNKTQEDKSFGKKQHAKSGGFDATPLAAGNKAAGGKGNKDKFANKSFSVAAGKKGQKKQTGRKSSAL